MRVGISGAAGYTGGELLRLLLKHPRVDSIVASSESRSGEPVWRAHPNLRGRTELAFAARVEPGSVDCLFFAGGHGRAMAELPAQLADGRAPRIVDLSADFRLRDPAEYARWYGTEHAAPELLARFAYGLPELNGAAVRAARCVANPGCFATAISLALAPLAKAGAGGVARVTAVTGSSGSGAQAGPRTHHPVREGSLAAYKPLAHQHAPEIEQLLRAAAGPSAPSLAIVPVSGPIVRGIYAVCHLDLPAGMDEIAARAAFESAYRGCPFIRLLDEPPQLNAVTGSNFCDLFVAARGGQLVAISALDNLVKGAAGQAVQNMNLMMGWEETAGLDAAGAYPG